MRTTLDISDDVLQAAKELARRQHRTAGEVISDLARRALGTVASAQREPEPFLGFCPFPPRGGVVTNDLVDRIRDDESRYP